MAMAVVDFPDRFSRSALEGCEGGDVHFVPQILNVSAWHCSTLKMYCQFVIHFLKLPICKW